MQITNVEVHKITPREGARLRGYASATIDGCFIIKDIKIYEKEDEETGETKLKLQFPNRKSDNKERGYDVAHPLRDMFEEAILTEYNKVEE